MSDAATLVAQADRAAAAQDLKGAQALLRQAAEADPGDFGVLMRLAGISRALGQPRVALDAAHAALAVHPLDFSALLLRASLLERIEDPRAGEAWGNALAQRPDGALPPQLAGIVAEAERRHNAWLDAREARLAQGTAAIEAGADEDERWRIARFRTNALRRTRVWHSEPTHYHFPGIAEREYHPRARFPWLEELEAATDAIAAELEAAMASERSELVPYIEYPDHLPLQQWRPLNRNPDWTAIHLYKNGKRVEANARHAPATLALLDRIGQPDIPGASPNAMFSLLAPGTSIPPHVGVNNARLVCHLPLVVPEGCWFRVGGETRLWERGRAWVFDDTVEHEAMNPSGLLRVVLILDVWHPDLTAAERAAVAAMIAADGGSSAGGL
ncbi:aspartyl/asparaginyl beta-hydroxylase domain-containing protein [Sphingomonas canadensis]|uniref:Aspartyl/asparaginyl beta-hydroxylase domain-containing protein n=1 Tax=Sphingomonas canadensis TaxID=1219257 RepID=A0ABW3H9B0_9SPHN|nr:aspartyl/asparaginyl beta-hydroxylase domain-containing protein [Sphingomonas canadensis]MCW3837138.1 aspartyl/asparaginyl beta-hydroxylase domain-containing protein [Sphingomonas canadensis]